METNHFPKLQQKSNLEEDIFFGAANVFSQDDSFDFEEDDLEKLEDLPTIDASEEVVDADYLSNINDMIDRSEKLTKLMDESPVKESGEHPMDAYLKKMILEVLVQDFLPILEKRIASIKK